MGEGWGFALPTRVRFGDGVAAELAREARTFGARPFVVTDPGIHHADLVDRVLAPSVGAGLPIKVFGGLSANPGDHECREGADRARRFGTDAVAGIGGDPSDKGSSIYSRGALDAATGVVPASEAGVEGTDALAGLEREVVIPRLADLPGFDPASYPVIARASARKGAHPSNARAMGEADDVAILERAWQAAA